VVIHTIRSVGIVSNALADLRPGQTVGLRGPFGTPWPVKAGYDRNLLIVAGGIGLAPLRPAVYHALANRESYRRVTLLYGSRTPNDLLYWKELEKWRARFDFEVHVTVDSARPEWRGNVGVVTRLFRAANLEPETTTAMVCGPEVMMRLSVRGLVQRGIGTDHIYVSMERNMKCAMGFCGHCQFGSEFICKDGPVFQYSKVEKLIGVREL
jgi:NAD(P)H-flavin reductase